MSSGEQSISFNGFWAKLALGVATVVTGTAIISGAAGLVVNIRGDERAKIRDQTLIDHEARLRVVEGGIGDLKSGVAILLERTNRAAILLERTKPENAK